MDEALDRLSVIQKKNINTKVFEIAYNCVIASKGDQQALLVEILKYPEFAPDLYRYCKLVESVI